MITCASHVYTLRILAVLTIRNPPHPAPTNQCAADQYVVRQASVDHMAFRANLLRSFFRHVLSEGETLPDGRSAYFQLNQTSRH